MGEKSAWYKNEKGERKQFLDTPNAETLQDILVTDIDDRLLKININSVLQSNAPVQVEVCYVSDQSC